MTRRQQQRGSGSPLDRVSPTGTLQIRIMFGTSAIATFIRFMDHEFEGAIGGSRLNVSARRNDGVTRPALGLTDHRLICASKQRLLPRMPR
jgi:hypothetical protein